MIVRTIDTRQRLTIGHLQNRHIIAAARKIIKIGLSGNIKLHNIVIIYIQSFQCGNIDQPQYRNTIISAVKIPQIDTTVNRQDFEMTPLHIKGFQWIGMCDREFYKKIIGTIERHDTHRRWQVDIGKTISETIQCTQCRTPRKVDRRQLVPSGFDCRQRRTLRCRKRGELVRSNINSLQLREIIDREISGQSPSPPIDSGNTTIFPRYSLPSRRVVQIYSLKLFMIRFFFGRRLIQEILQTFYLFFVVILCRKHNATA